MASTDPSCLLLELSPAFSFFLGTDPNTPTSFLDLNLGL
jgi:hypothetical protein